MSIEITHVHFGGLSKNYEGITEYRWRSDDNGNVGTSDRATMVDWIDKKGGVAYVREGAYAVNVDTVHPAMGTPYLRTHADGRTTNNLLDLPTF